MGERIQEQEQPKLERDVHEFLKKYPVRSAERAEALEETQLELRFAVEGQSLLHDDVGSKVSMIRK